MNESPHPRRDAGVRAETLPDGSAMLYDSRSGMAYALTASAAQVWASCDGTRTLDAIARRLMDIYDAPAGIVQNDIAALLADLQARGLVEWDGGVAA